MNYTTAHIVYFSPTHTSQKVGCAISRGVNMERNIETNLTFDQSLNPVIIKDALAIIAVPVYAGRVAPLALERVKAVRGENTPAILVAVYGNRDYEDALVELRDKMEAQGFITLAAAAFIGEHSYSRKNMPIAEGRPDIIDIVKAESFGKLCRIKLDAGLIYKDDSFLLIKGNVPYREVKKSAPVAPLTEQERCSTCGECIGVCPTNAISFNSEGEIETDEMKCIKCCACVKECPNEARIFDTPYTAMLYQNFSRRREPELFI